MVRDGVRRSRAAQCGSLLVVVSLILSVGCSDDASEREPSGGRADASGDTSFDSGADVGIDSGADVSADTTGEVTADIEIDTGPPQIVSDSFSVRATVEQIYVWNAEAETDIEVLGPLGDVVVSGATDHLGSIVFRELEPGDGYVVRLAEDHDDFTDQLEVMSEENSLPDQSFYDGQTIEPGFGYLTMRDGTTLSYFAALPGPPEDGPYPTLLNYSGYSPSRPGQSLGGAAELFCGDYPILCDAPDFASGLFAGIMGYAVIGVNVRGSGCSGGAYDYFEPLQLLDGYDAIEIIAAQDWVQYHHVGMIGLSYPGITQLFVASTQPPSLAAIAPFSTLADTGSSTLLPGGIYNDGFAIGWISWVLDKAAPYAHGWITDVVEAGDEICEENQLLHDQRLDAVSKAFDNPFYSDDVAKPVDPTSFAHLIEVPVYQAGQWQDEQTGPHFPALFDKYTGSPLTRFTVTNGVHMDGFAPQNVAEWANFIDFYVARRIPTIDPTVRTMVPVFMEQVFGAALEIPAGRFEDYDDFDQALADYEAEDALRVIFETGAHPDVEPGAPQGTFEVTFSAWPIVETEATRWYLYPGGTLEADPPGADGGASSFEPDPDSGHRGTLNSGSVNPLQPDWDWPQLIEGKAMSFITEPLSEDLVMIGHGSIDLWFQSTAADADIEVMLTEVRPDGDESYVQAGWLRASHRALRDDATELRPVKSHYQRDLENLVAGEWNELRVELMPFTHIFRAGSRIRLSLDTPGDSMASWRFLLLDYETLPTHSVAHNEVYPSSIVLPVIPGIDVPTDLPACNALRGQPCRTYVEFVNEPME